MSLPARSWAILAGLVASAWAATGASAAQETLLPSVNQGEQWLRFDWPALRIGTAEYAAGPTGVTVFHFPQRALGAVDVRGGGPGTVNTDFIRIGYDYPELDAVVFSGGSLYGLESTTAIATALMDDNVRSGSWDNIAIAAGAIIYDFGTRRLNEIYPDKRLAQAAFHAGRAGIFPLGAQGAGRFAISGSFFGCNAYSGQGGAFVQIGAVKIAAFTVVNALGVVTDREGRVAACYRPPGTPQDSRATELLRNYVTTRSAEWSAPASAETAKKNTTVSLIVVNQKLTPVELQRLAIQVHSSMGRALQPFATQFDGDVLYAVSTGEIGVLDGERPIAPIELGVVAGELMWDAVLSSVPRQPAMPQPDPARTAPAGQVLRRWTGEYRFSAAVAVQISEAGGKLFALASGDRDAYGIGRKDPVELRTLGATEFFIPGRYPVTLSFATPDRLIFNPGHWSQVGVRSR